MPKGYRCSIAIAIAACLQLATGTTKAAETTYTANDLLQDCKDSLLERKVPPRPFHSGLCMGLVAGVNYVDAKSCAKRDQQPANARGVGLYRSAAAADARGIHEAGRRGFSQRMALFEPLRAGSIKRRQIPLPAR